MAEFEEHEARKFNELGPQLGGITNRLRQALERGERITELYIRSSVTKQFSPHRHAVYTSATGDIPNMALHPPRGLDISGNIVPHVIGVERNTDLHDLWARARPFIDPRGTTRVFWAACSSIKAGGNPCVDLQAD